MDAKLLVTIILYGPLLGAIVAGLFGKRLGNLVSMSVTNAEAIGRVLYTNYVYFFQAAGMVLLVAMIGAIVLTLRHRPGVRRQNVAKQVARTRKTGMDVVSVKSGEGIPE